ncbi:retrovirus-related pol polyprotein from transposon TNT 1-94 [Tanacetum coccineum]
MAAGQRKLETQWTPGERKAANLNQRLKSLIMFVLLNDQINSVINCLTTKSTWDDLMLYHKGLFDVKFKEGESLTQTFTRYKALMNELVNDGIKLSKLEINTGFINGLPKKWLAFCQSLRNTNHVKESELASLFDSHDDENDTRSSQEYMNDLEEEYQARALLPKSKRFFKKGTQRFSSSKVTDQTKCHKCGKKGHFARDCWSKTLVPLYQSPFHPKLLHSSEHKPEPRHTKDFKAKYNKVKAKLALFSSSASTPSSSSGKNKGLIAETNDWDEEEVSSDDNEVTEVKALMALADEERVSVSKESAINGEWIKISLKNVHTFLEIEDNDDRKSFLDYLCIDLNYHVNTEILKENQNLRNEAKELTSITEAWLNSSNKVNQYNLEVSIIGSNKPKLSEAEDSTLSNHDTGKEPSNESQRNTTDHSVVVSDSSSTNYDSTDESSVCIIINEPSSTLARGNKSSSASKTNLAPAGKLKNMKIEDDTPLAIVPPNALQNNYKTQFKMNYELCEQNNHLFKNCYEVLFCKKCKRTNHRTCDHAEFMSSMNINQYHTGQGEYFSGSRLLRPAIPFPSCIHCGYNDHKSDDCVYYPICEICGSYDHDSYGHNKIISLRRRIKPRNP